jgi:membrane-bound metal-dependent hydrolase YbcI (DUF457 family)
MFIGHFGVGFGAKRLAPQLSLGLLFIAAQFLDLLWPSLLTLGVERVRIAPGDTLVTPLAFEHYPLSHSLLAAAAWAGLLACVYYRLKRERGGAVVLAMLVLSHWGLDAIVHRPDLPLYPGGASFVGMSLWQSLVGTLAVELTLFAVGVRLYSRSTQAIDASGRWGLRALVAFLLLIEASNLLGPPPPSEQAIAWVGQAQWLIVLWGFWIDKHRAALALPRPMPARA